MGILKPWVVGVAMAVALAVVPSASAATEIGDPCSADREASFTGATFFQITAPESPLPQAAPSNGVVTRWKTSLFLPGPTFFALKVIRVTAPKMAQVVGESPQEMVVKGANAFSTRIPIQTGDHLGLFGLGKEGMPYCAPTSLVDVFGDFDGNVPAGSPAHFIESPEARVPVTAVIEPDADRDGYGDETQDRCPQSAEFHDACPAIGLEVVPVLTKGSVVVLVVADHPAPVTVTGLLGRFGETGRSVKALGRAPVRAPHFAIKLTTGAQSLVGGRIGRFTLKFPRRLKAMLALRQPDESLKMRIVVSASNVAGQITTSSSTVKLKGTAQGRSKQLPK